MPIKVQCSCGQVLAVPDDKAGKSGKCPKCQNLIQIPVAGGQAAGSGAAKTAPQAKAAGSAAVASSAPKAAVKKVASAAATQVTTAPAPKLDSLFDEVGLKQKTGPCCPKCGASIATGAVICVQCGLNFESGEQALGYNVRIETQEFENEFLQEAASNMQRDVLMDERRDKSGVPWWMLLSYLFGAVTLMIAGIIIVDGRLGTPAPEGSLMGNLQRLPIFTILGATLIATGQCIHMFAHLSIVVFAFRKSIGAGFGCLLVPFFSYVYGIMNWADNKSALMAVVTSIVTAGAGVGLVLAAGGFGLLQQAFYVY